MADRSSRAEVRNPMMQLASVQALFDLPPDVRAQVAAAFRGVSADARERADKCWRTHKAPMAAYWKGKAVDFRHLAVALSRRGNIDRSPA